MNKNGFTKNYEANSRIQVYFTKKQIIKIIIIINQSGGLYIQYYIYLQYTCIYTCITQHYIYSVNRSVTINRDVKRGGGREFCSNTQSQRENDKIPT